jgi:radical SAM superfamily enzyme YgiQ (UPF0313 family)
MPPGVLKMDIALVQCPCYSIKMPPLGIAALCAVLKKRHFRVRVFDFNAGLYQKYGELWKQENDAYWFPENFFLRGEELDHYVSMFAEKILEFPSSVIGFSIAATSRVLSILVARRIKERDDRRVIIFGGPECLREKPEVFFDSSCVDYIVQGEGEETLLDLLARIKKGVSTRGCLGVIFREGGRVCVNEPRPLVRNLDALPFPDFSVFDRDKYLDKMALPMLASRGCIRHCAFCFDRWYYREKYRVRSAKSIVAELKCLVNNYGVRSVYFSDLLLNGHLRNLEKLCDLLIKERMGDIELVGSAAVRVMDKSLLLKMRRAGFSSLTFGIESGSQKVLDLMGKGTHLGEIRLLVKDAAQAGINVTANWLLGFPGEEKEDVVETMRFILDNRRYIAGTGSVCVLAINAPTTIYRQASSLGIRLREDSALDWSYRDNSPQERKRRAGIFFLFLKEVGLLDGSGRIFSEDYFDDSGRREGLLEKYAQALQDNPESFKADV